jgi:hypothetical protein
LTRKTLETIGPDPRNPVSFIGHFYRLYAATSETFDALEDAHAQLENVAGLVAGASDPEAHRQQMTDHQKDAILIRTFAENVIFDHF